MIEILVFVNEHVADQGIDMAEKSEQMHRNDKIREKLVSRRAKVEQATSRKVTMTTWSPEISLTPAKG